MVHVKQINHNIVNV